MAWIVTRPFVRALGIDLGTKRIGLAVGDTETSLALPLRTLEATGGLEALAAKLIEIAQEEGCETLVVGNPLRLDGTSSDSTRRSKQLAKALRGQCSLKVVLWDERLSTSAAHRSLMSSSTTRASGRRDHVDQVAASIFLQAFLDSQGERRWTQDHDVESPVPPASDRRRGSSSRS